MCPAGGEGRETRGEGRGTEKSEVCMTRKLARSLQLLYLAITSDWLKVTRSTLMTIGVWD